MKQEPHPAELIPVSVAWSDRCLSITGYFTHGCKNIHAPQKSNLSAGVVILLFHTFSVLKAENDQLIHLHSFLIFLETSDSSINKIKFACFSFIIINYFLMVLESFMESVFYSFFLVKELFLQMISLLFQLTNLGKHFFFEQCTQSQLNHIPPTSSQPSIHPSRSYSFPCKLVTRIWCYIKIQVASTWWLWVFSLSVCFIMFRYWWEKLHVDHLWEFKD